VHPVLFHIGAVLVPSYGAAAALGVLLALALTQRAARVVRVYPAKVWNLSVLSLFVALACSYWSLLVWQVWLRARN